MRTSYQVDDLTIHRIIESQTGFGHITEFFPALDAAAFARERAWLEAAGAITATGEIVLCFQSYVVRTPHHTILVDGCFGNDKTLPRRPDWHRSKSPAFMAAFVAAGLRVEDIDIVMCTHLHADHVGWNTRLDNGAWTPTFPRARYLLSATELAFWEARHAEEALPYMTESVLPVIAAGRADLVSSAHEIGEHVRLLPTPGHTPDHFAVRLGRGQDRAVLTGDLIHSPLQLRFPELAMRADFDPAQASATRRSFLERYADTPTLCCTAHFPDQSAGLFRRDGAAFRCDLA
jgi:glyoxylase-like metal-dependent hydrolase (beta-lactamase superfamily II)